MLKITYLKWDSDFFGLSIAKVEINQGSAGVLKEIINLKIEQGYDLVYLFSPEPLNEDISPVDIKLEYMLKVDKNLHKTDKELIYYNVNYQKSILNLALISGRYSRFKSDERLKYKFADLYETWLNNSINKNIADAIMVTTFREEVTGFVTVKGNNDSSRIGLIAVDPAFQKRGYGSELLESVKIWAMERNHRTIYVVTQEINKPACKLYVKNGFKLFNKDYVYHI